MSYTLPQIIGKLEKICTDHPQIKSYTDLAKLNDDGQKHLKCPYIGYDVRDVLINGRLSYMFYIACMTSKEENREDIRESQGDTAQIIVDVVSSLEAAEILDQNTDIIGYSVIDNSNARTGYYIEEYLHSERMQCNG